MATPRPRRKLPGWGIIAAVLVVDALVCVPFLLDPLDLLGANPVSARVSAAPAAVDTSAASASVADPAGTPRLDYLVFLSGADALQALEAHVARQSEWRLEHSGGLLGTALVSLPAGRTELVEALRQQPFAALVAAGGRALCTANP